MAQIMNFPSLSNAYNQSVWWRWKDYSALIFLLISGPLCRFSKLNSSFNGTLLCFHHSPSQKCHQSFWKKTLTSQNHLHAENWQTLNKNCSKEDGGFLQIIKCRGRSVAILQTSGDFILLTEMYSDRIDGSDLMVGYLILNILLSQM